MIINLMRYINRSSFIFEQAEYIVLLWKNSIYVICCSADIQVAIMMVQEMGKWVSETNVISVVVTKWINQFGFSSGCGFYLLHLMSKVSALVCAPCNTDM